MAIYNAAWAIPLLPLLGALLSFGVETQRRAAQLCAAFTGLSFVVAAVMLGVRLTHAPQAAFDSLLTFFAMNPPEGAVFATQFEAQLGIHIDALSVSFAAAIAFATLLIQVYALTAMRGEPGYRRFFWASSLLGFSTTAFVLSPNLFDSLMMWVAASASLYLLASLAWQRADAAIHALRVMVVLTAGDIALTLGVVFVWIKFGVFSSLLAAPPGQTLADPFSFGVVSQGVLGTLHHAVAATGPRAITVMAIVFSVAAVLRAAQFPFHVWLADTAASAIPVLALAAATVAPLGLFLLARVYPVLAHAPRVLPAVALVGGVSAIAMAVAGIAQLNLRRIAMYAVAAELGLGLVALGMGGYSPGVFIAFTSIFLSTLVLMAAGNLIRIYRTDDITEMGGAWPKLRTTSIALGGWALLAGGLGLSSYYALSATFSGADPAGGVFSGLERTVVTIVTVVAAAAGATLAGRVLLTVASGAVTRRRGFQHDRIAEVEPGLRRPLWLALVAAVAAVLVGLPGLQPFDLGRRIAGLTFTRFVFYGTHHQAIDVNGIAALVALLTLAAGMALAVFLYGAARPSARTAAPAPLPVRVLQQGFYVEWLTEAGALQLARIASRVSSFDEQVTAPIAMSVGESVDLAAGGLGLFRNARLGRYLAGGLVLIAVLALLAVLAATGHLWVHTAGL
jgi:NADH:ubiquinone oxidoreductase subunit 5 (subunit L)/multisubunit Na+/H+ antiporter MnhA subunit